MKPSPPRAYAVPWQVQAKVAGDLPCWFPVSIQQDDERVAGRHRFVVVVGPRHLSLEQHGDRHCRQGREGEAFVYLHMFCPSVLFVSVFLTTAKGRVAGEIPIPSCRPSVVECFVTAAGSGHSQFQTTLHALRFSASFNQELTCDGDLLVDRPNGNAALGLIQA